MDYSFVAVIYNPNSTGPSQGLAEQFASRVRQRLRGVEVQLIATEHAKHGEELAYQLAAQHQNPLIISASGDGGYNDIINGVMKAKQVGFRATTGLLPAGNANDHHSNLHSQDIVEQIASGRVSKIDLLKITSTSRSQPLVRYAHSYIGLGLTPFIGKELNKEKLNPFKEVWIVLRSLVAVKAVPLRINGRVKYYDSIVFSNIDVMSKYLKIAQSSEVDDGQYEVTAFRQRHRVGLISLLLKASLKGIREDMKTDRFELETVKTTEIQADGEMVTLDAGVGLEIGIEKQILDCIV